MRMIPSFDGENKFLSNFYPVEIEFEGLAFSSVEAAYQAAKSLDKRTRRAFVLLSASEAKKKGRSIALRSDWEQVKVPIMEELLNQKFAVPELAQLLLETGNAELTEGNWWGDTFWGICKGKGQNMLGVLLMKIREKIKGGKQL